ncbi:SseB family protein [Kocuria sp. p3-SID1433]|uniref:SseB family protein n=1 Tax=unclassified Kocuria TaxID=2649579 RepID=UPI0021A524CD|nr:MULTISPECIES: SseB family protein [unclassified Kocuria]MCT1602327.1 SseB family protein [Kocuria sp. p3-SID1428]MCT2180964.1 SseB family protein [Kocuria sp. p3-SID1433]
MTQEPTPTSTPVPESAGRRSGTHSAELRTDAQTAELLQQELRTIGQWMLGVVNVQPGWQRMILDLKPQDGRVWLRISEERDGRVLPGTVGPLNAASPVLRSIERLQSLSYRPGRGTWFATSVIVLADGGPDPQHRFTARHAFDERPEVFGEEGPYGLEDALEHLERFPRTEDRVPSWLGEMAAQAEVSIPVLAPEDVASAVDESTVNPLLREAVLGFAAAPSEEAMIEVLRQAMQGVVVLDASGSDLVPGPEGEQPGPDSTIRLQSLRDQDGAVGLVVFTSEEEARQAFRRFSDQEGGEPTLLRQPALVPLQILMQDEQYDHLVLDPGQASCRIPRRQIQWALSSPHNDVVKGGLVAGSIPQILGGMVGRESQLLVATEPAQDGSVPPPVFASNDDGTADTLYIFTSAVEVAALDRSLEARAASGREVLRMALESGARRIRLNARAPMAVFEMDEIFRLLASLEESEEQGRRAAEGAQDDSGDDAEDPGSIPSSQPFSPDGR